MNTPIFITGIDTGCGKTVITGRLAKALLEQNVTVITQKLVQTGCDNISEDIVSHRQIMETGLLEEDESGMTCPYVLHFPSSPHVASEIEKIQIDCNKITECSIYLRSKYDVVLLEGSGGLMTPITRKKKQLEYVLENNLPLILVSSSMLGSINHTMLNLELIRQKKCNLIAIVFNDMPGVNYIISDESFAYISDKALAMFPNIIIEKNFGVYPEENEVILPRITSLIRNMMNEEKK